MALIKLMKSFSTYKRDAKRLRNMKFSAALLTPLHGKPAGHVLMKTQCRVSRGPQPIRTRAEIQLTNERLPQSPRMSRVSPMDHPHRGHNMLLVTLTHVTFQHLGEFRLSGDQFF